MMNAMLLLAGAALLPAGVLAASTTPPSLRPGGTPVDGPYLVLGGSLHDHSEDSDGHAPPANVAGWLAANRAALGIDFGTLSEHSDELPGGIGELSFGNPGHPDEWGDQGRLDAQVSVPGAFTFLRGFEYTSDQENHLNIIGSQNYARAGLYAGQALDASMTPFYDFISTPPIVDPTGQGLGYGGRDGVGQFNHPSLKGALNFDDYAFNPRAAANMAEIEIQGDQSFPGGLTHSDGGWYWFALERGWTVGPTMDWDNHYWTDKFAQLHPGAQCGTTTYLPCQRSLVFAAQNTRSAILDALRQRRVAATDFPSTWASLRTASGTWMGSTVAARPGQRLGLVVDAGSPAFPLTSVTIVGDNGVSPFPYYYGDNLSCSNAPYSYAGDLNPNCLSEELGDTSLAPSYAIQHHKYVSSNGHATKKAQIDAPPAGTTVARTALSGMRRTVRLTITVPTVPSARPDGKHFFYAIVTAGSVRVWTAPIFVTATNG